VTSPRDDLLGAVAALAPSAVMRLLAGAAADPGEPPPEVRICLAGGQVLDGALVIVGSDHGQGVVVLAAADGRQLSYALAANVAAVEVRGPHRFADIFTGGQLPQPEPAGAEPVTRLSLQREFPPSAEFPLQVDWAALPGSGAVLANLARLLAGLREVARQARADEMGRRAWAQVRALQVAHRDGANLSVRRMPGGMSVQADLSAALPRDLAGQIGQQINALL